MTVRYAVRINGPGAGIPAGNVTVGDGIDGCTATVAAGQCTLALRSVGARTLFAGYAGNPNYRPSASAGVPHTVLAPLPPLAHVTGTSQTHRRFRVSPKPRLAQASRARPPIGTTFRYTLDHPATVRLDFTQPDAGRNVKGRCVAPTKRNQRKPKCTRARGTMTFSGHPGVNSVRFKGWLTRTKKLTPGKYTLTVTAITPTVGTTAQKLKFTIVR